MPGYRLIEQRVLKPFNPDGIDAHPNCKGFLDYLRELRQDSFPFQRGYRLRVEGLEDVLLAAGDRLREVESLIRTIMASRTNELDSVMGTNVQVIFRDKLVKSADFWVEAGLRRHLSLRQLFRTPVRQQGPNGTEFFYVGFNLT